MSLLNNLNSAAKGASVTITLDKSALFALGVVAANADFAAQTDTVSLEVIFRSSVGGQVKKMFFDLTQSVPSAELYFSSYASDMFTVQKMILRSADEAVLVVTGNGIPSGLDVNLGGSQVPTLGYTELTIQNLNTLEFYVGGENIPDDTPIRISISGVYGNPTSYMFTLNGGAWSETSVGYIDTNFAGTPQTCTFGCEISDGTNTVVGPDKAMTFVSSSPPPSWPLSLQFSQWWMDSTQTIPGYIMTAPYEGGGIFGFNLSTAQSIGNFTGSTPSDVIWANPAAPGEQIAFYSDNTYTTQISDIFTIPAY